MSIRFVVPALFVCAISCGDAPASLVPSPPQADPLAAALPRETALGEVRAAGLDDRRPWEVAELLVEREYEPRGATRAKVPQVVNPPAQRFRLAFGTNREGSRVGTMRVLPVNANDGSVWDRQISEIRLDGDQMTLRDPAGRVIAPPTPGQLPELPNRPGRPAMRSDDVREPVTPGIVYTTAQLSSMAVQAQATIEKTQAGIRLLRSQATASHTTQETREYAAVGGDAYRVRRIALEIRTATTGSTMRTTTHFAVAADSARPAAPPALLLAPLVAAPAAFGSRALAPARPVRSAAVHERSVLPTCPDGRRAGTTPSGYEIILQHGILSRADTWCATEDQLHAQLHLAGTQKYSTTSVERLHVQARQLATARVAPAAGSAGTIVVGHSQGGLIGRHMAQELHRSFPLGGPIDTSKGSVAGIITIGTPHRGAPLVPGLVNVATIAQEMGFFAGLVYCDQWNPTPPWGGSDPSPGPMQFIGPSWTSYLACLWSSQVIINSVFGFVYSLVPGHLVGFGGTLNGAFIDLHPSSYFLQHLNDAYEPFRRVAIYHTIPSHFSFCRLGYEFDREDVVNGRTAAEVCEATAMNALFRWSVLQLVGGHPSESGFYGAIVTALYAADHAYNLVIGTYVHGPGDGVVPTSSQLWPLMPGAFAPAQYTEFSGVNPQNDSHVRQTRGGVSRVLLDKALREQFDVQRILP
jgi:pimeloyl-ACP methyl ester carboxylesterase